MQHLVNIWPTVQLAKIGSWKMEKKIVILAFQKVAKTGNIGKKVQWQAISIK